MEGLTARPMVLKQANLSRIREVIKAKGTATRAEIAEETNISSTTVRSLLTEMQQNGEIESVGYDESSGGRKAERYALNPNRYYGVAFCISDNKMDSLLINMCGEILETVRIEAGDGDYQQVITDYMDKIMKEKEIKSIGIGVPGIVEGGSFWKQDAEDKRLYKSDIGEQLAEKYKVPVVMENDLNATAIGFQRCYEHEFPCENPEDSNMVYLHFEKGCISAGIIAGGKIIRGYRNFAGEVGLIPVEDEKLLDEWLSEAESDIRYTDAVIKVLCWICGILNPQYIVLGGPGIRKDCVAPISDGLLPMFPKHMQAEILYSPDVWGDYHEGMAYLTAGKMFGAVQLIKE